MWSWWNSVESVSRFNSIIQTIIFFLAIITALAMLLSYKASQQINNLQSHEKSLMQKRIDDLSPRHLNDETKNKLINEFIKLKGTEIIIEHPDDTETSIFAQEIKKIMLSSGISAKRFSIVGGPLPQGIFISAGFPEITQNILLNAFTSIGMTTYIDSSPEVKGNSIYIGIKQSSKI